jgi:hypothetical protein
MLIRAFILVLGLLLGACVFMPGTRGGPGSEFARKLVMGKVAPNELIADDNSRCVTSRERFDRTRIGSEVWCLWSGGDVRDAPNASSPGERE